MSRRERPKRVPGPVSVVLPVELRRRVASEARKRGLKLSSTVRLLVAERLSDMEATEDLTKAQEWQRAQAWASWERLAGEGLRDVGAAAIDEEFERAPRTRRRR
jgi:hypothetical protein